MHTLAHYQADDAGPRLEHKPVTLGTVRATGAEVLMAEVDVPHQALRPGRDGAAAQRTDLGRVHGALRGQPHRARGLFHIQEHHDGSLCFRYCCRASICGSCAMYINGRYRLACQTNVATCTDDVITVEPLPHMPLVKDLVCDMTDFFAKYEYIKPWLIRSSQDPGEGDPAVARGAPQARHAHRLHPLRLLLQLAARRCGARTTTSARRRCSRPTASRSTRATRPARSACRCFDNERGVYRCHTITNCVEACPKELNPTEGIQWLKMAAVRRRLFGRLK